MHSDLDQKEREDVLLDFKAGKINVVVATDILSRGIDIDNIETVINYDVPHEAEDYVHRIGRTARADKDGSAYTFISEKERGKFRIIERLLEKDVEKLPVPEDLGEAPEYGNDNQKTERKDRRNSKKRFYRGNRDKGQKKKSGSSRPRNKSQNMKKSDNKTEKKD